MELLAFVLVGSYLVGQHRMDVLPAIVCAFVVAAMVSAIISIISNAASTVPFWALLLIAIGIGVGYWLSQPIRRR